MRQYVAHAAERISAEARDTDKLAGMERTRLTGAILMGAVALELLLFLRALSRGSYAAVAVPAALLVLVISALVFWTGWTLLQMEDELEGLEFATEPIDNV